MGRPFVSPPSPFALTSQRAIESDYAAICDVAPQLANIATLEEFQWARMCVCSRNFG
jgi:histone-lysine N-methyltransferase SETD3